MKIESAASIILILLILFVQFFLPLSYYNGNDLNAIESYTNLKDLHWGFYYFVFIIFVIIIGIILDFLHNFDKHKFSYWFDFTFWTVGCWGQVVIGWQIQDFLKAHPFLPVRDEANTLAISFFVTMIIWLISIVKLVATYYEKTEKEIKTT